MIQAIKKFNPKCKYVLIVFFALLCAKSYTQHDELLINVRNRDVTSLNGKWRYLLDINKKSMGFEHNRIPKSKTDFHEYNFPTSDWLYVPGDWNSQRDFLLFYEGRIWYQKDFTYSLPENKKLFIWFGATNYLAEVYLNGVSLGIHEGGFTPFNFEIPDSLLKTNNNLVVSVDNTRKQDGIPPFETDWLNYGGITRDVYLVEVDDSYIRDYKLSLEDHASKKISGHVQLDGEKLQENVAISIPALNKTIEGKTNDKGRWEFSFSASGLKLWSPGSPNLYKVEIITPSDTLVDKIGFRTIKTRGTDILLNGKPIFLRGICVHEVNPLGTGRGWSEESSRVTLERARDLNCNFIRISHYPHNEYMALLADEMGLLLWEEIPLYWSVDWENQQTYQFAEDMMTEMMTRDQNRASVIIWGLANETGNNPPRNAFLKNLARHAREFDNNDRLLSAALFINHEKSTKYHKVVDDPLGEYLDIISVNEYFGWYQGLPSIIDSITWEIDFNKPFMFSELGAGALQGFHGDSLTRWSEDYQASFYKETFKMLEKIDKLRGVSPWLLSDFKSPRRLFPFIQDFYNKKGLISERGDRKEAFYLLQEYYEEKQNKDLLRK
jgi:beta-glucuronidase